MKIVILLFLLFFNSLIYSQRIISNDYKLGILKNYDNYNIYVIEQKNPIFYKLRLNKVLKYNISKVCIIKNELNNFIVINELRNNLKKPIVYKLQNKKVKYIWVLTDKEYKKLISKKNYYEKSIY